ncbi:MAG: RNA polymerase sigma factor [Candidatus Aminicenantes bacterium]|nr:MAG: RNA polymerase sigma factor [Candidatus Aminicenantes bacterium]
MSSLIQALKLPLVAREQDGNRFMGKNQKELWEKFYTNHSRSFWFYIYKICGDENMADDIYQESFVKFLKAKPDIANETHLKVYLYRIAYHLIVDKKRRIKVEKRSFEEKVHTYERDMHNSGQESGVLLSMEMEKTFKRLKPKQRMLLWLAYVEGYSYREIAQMTHTKENSLKVQLFRAREKLTEILKAQEQEGRI